MASKTETKHPQLHYFRTLAWRTSHWSFAVGDSDGMAIACTTGHVLYQIYHKLSDSLINTNNTTWRCSFISIRIPIIKTRQSHNPVYTRHLGYPEACPYICCLSVVPSWSLSLYLLLSVVPSWSLSLCLLLSVVPSWSLSLYLLLSVVPSWSLSLYLLLSVVPSWSLSLYLLLSVVPSWSLSLYLCCLLSLPEACPYICCCLLSLPEAP